MSQSPIVSAIESTANIASGFVISYLVWLFVVPLMFGEDVSTQDPGVAFWLTCIFTVTSWLRSYVWRRYFNSLVRDKANAITQ